MSRGVGKTQQRILDALLPETLSGLTVVELAELIGCTDGQVRRAVYALNRRGSVVLVKASRRHGTALTVWDPINRDIWLGNNDPARAVVEREMRRRGIVAVLRA